MYPDEGLTRLRCFGELPREARAELYERLWEVLPDEHQEYLARHGSDVLPAPPTVHSSD